MKWRAIAPALHVSRNTVRWIVNEHGRDRQLPHTALPARRGVARPSKVDPHRLRIEELLRIYQDITAQRVFEIPRAEEGYQAATPS
jgi:orotate phosphoribosyltransferase-like protein